MTPHVSQRVQTAVLVALLGSLLAFGYVVSGWRDRLDGEINRDRQEDARRHADVFRVLDEIKSARAEDAEENRAALALVVEAVREGRSVAREAREDSRREIDVTRMAAIAAYGDAVARAKQAETEARILAMRVQDMTAVMLRAGMMLPGDNLTGPTSNSSALEASSGTAPTKKEDP